MRPTAGPSGDGIPSTTILSMMCTFTRSSGRSMRQWRRAEPPKDLGVCRRDDPLGRVDLDPRATDMFELLPAGNVERMAERLRALWPWTPLVSLLWLILETVIPPLPAWPILVANAAYLRDLRWHRSVARRAARRGHHLLDRPLIRSLLPRKALKDDHLETIDSISREKGFLILLVARVFPVTSLDILSFLAGLSSISFSRFFMATALGLLPGVSIYTLFAHDLLVTRAITTRLSLVVGSALLIYALYASGTRESPQIALKSRKGRDGPSRKYLSNDTQNSDGGVRIGFTKGRSAAVYGARLHEFRPRTH